MTAACIPGTASSDEVSSGVTGKRTGITIISAGFVARPRQHGITKTLVQVARNLILNPFGDRLTTFRTRCAPDFIGAHLAKRPSKLPAAGRFVETKAPNLTPRAFKKLVESIPDARLTMVGDGPLLAPCKCLATELGISGLVTFPGIQNPDQIRDLMRSSRAFVQHSLVAENGDSERTPVAVIEAQMTGLPVVATRHGGIPEVVIDGETGFLVQEGDVEGMVKSMRQLADSPELARRFGEAGHRRALCNFTLDRHLGELSQMIQLRVSAR